MTHSSMKPAKWAIDAPLALGLITATFLLAPLFSACSSAEAATALTRFVLINAETDQPIGTLVNGSTINLTTLPTRKLNILAVTEPAVVSQVAFRYSSTAVTSLEKSPPYALAGNDGANYNAWTPALGAQTLTGTATGKDGTTGSLSVKFNVVSQTSWFPPMKIHALSNNLGDVATGYMKLQPQAFGAYKIFTHGAFLNPNDSTLIDEERMIQELNRQFPDVNSTEILVLDWESAVTQDLYDYAPGDARFEEATAKFLRLLSIVRKHRPKLKVSFYGLPARFFWPSQKAANLPANKFDRILSKLDFINPTLYIVYTDEDAGGHERNLQFLRDNLNVALEYGVRLNKPVVPFIWHRITNRAKPYNDRILTQAQFVSFMKLIGTHTFQGRKTSGMLWWETGLTSIRLTQGVYNDPTDDFSSMTQYSELMKQYAIAVQKALAL